MIFRKQRFSAAVKESEAAVNGGQEHIGRAARLKNRQLRSQPALVDKASRNMQKRALRQRGERFVEARDNNVGAAGYRIRRKIL